MVRRVARINLVRRDRRRSGAEGGTGGQHSIKAAAGFWQKMMGCIGTVGTVTGGGGRGRNVHIIFISKHSDTFEGHRWRDRRQRYLSNTNGTYLRAKLIIDATPLLEIMGMSTCIRLCRNDRAAGSGQSKLEGNDRTIDP